MSAIMGNGARIRTNTPAELAYNANFRASADIANRQLRIATGQRINAASDDVSGFITSRTLMTRVGALRAAANAVGDAKNTIIIAQDALDNVAGLLTQIKDAAATAASGSLGTDERVSLARAAYRLTEQIQTVVDSAVFGGRTVLGGGFSGDFIIGFGAGSSPITISIDLSTATGGPVRVAPPQDALPPRQPIGREEENLPGLLAAANVNITVRQETRRSENGFMVDVNATRTEAFAGVEGLNLGELNRVNDTGLGIFSREQVASTIQSISSALDNVSKLGSYLGGLINRIESQEQSIASQTVNLNAAVSRIRDADYAQEQLQLIRSRFLLQTSTISLAQSNQNPLVFLSLLG